MTDKQDMLLDIEAQDNATPNITKVMAAFDRLREVYDAAAAHFAQVAGFEAPAKAMEQVMDRAAASMMTNFDKLGMHAEAQFGRIVNASRIAGRQMEAAAEKAAQAHIAAQARASEETAFLVQGENQRLQKIREQEAAAIGREINAGLQAEARRAQAETHSREDTFFMIQEINKKTVQDDEARFAKMAAAAEKAAAQERTYREDLFFFVQAENQRLIASDEARAAAAEKAAARAAAAAHAPAGGGSFGGDMGTVLGGLGGFAGGAASMAGGALGMLGNVAGGAAQAGLNLLLAPIQAIGSAFTDIIGSIADAGKELANFIAIGTGIYGMVQILQMVQQAFVSLKQGIIDFQDVMVRVGSLTGANVAEMQDMSAAILQVSMQTGRSASELGEAMYFIQSHGIRGAQALEVLGDAGKLAAAGLGDTNQIVRVVAGQMLAYGASVDQTTHYFDVFARTVQISAVPAAEVANTFARITPLAAALHVGVEEVGADFATISQTGLNASRVMTDLVAVFNQFLQGSKQQQEALKSIGLTIDQVRGTLSEHGLIAAAEQIWQAADRDIAKVGQVFGDRSRALIGYLALVEDGGRRADENLQKMQASAGTTQQVFEAALTRISVQWQRFTNIVQAFAIAATSTALPGIAHDLDAINDALQDADFERAGDAMVTAFQHAAQMVGNVLDTLGKSMFGAGMTMMETLANGIIQGINTVLNAAVTAVADFIAGFLLGHSWPPRGPLANGDAGVTAWQQQYASTMTSNGQIMANAATAVADQVNTELGKIGAGPNSKEGLQLAIANIDQQLLPWKLAAEDIKGQYEGMIHPLDRQIAAIQRIKDLEYERKQLGFEQRDLELSRMRLQAEGDPARRAQLAGQLARLQESREQHSIDARIATLNREAANLKPGRGTSPQEIALRRREIGDELAILRVQQQQHRLTNVELLGQYETKKAQLDTDKESAKLNHDAFTLEQKRTLQPLLEQRDKLKFQEQAELDIIDAQTQGLDNQRSILQAHLQLVNAITAANKAGSAAGGAPWRMPDMTEDVGVGVGKGISDNIGKLAEQFSTRLSKGVTDFFATNGPRIGAGLVGAIVGGMVGGIPGAIAGAVFGPRLIDALEERGVTGSDLQRFADRFMGSLKDAFSRVSNKLSAHDFLGAVQEVMVTARAWIAEFERSFFREWTTSTVTDAAGGMPMVTTTRWTGLGRTIIEAMFGQQDEGLNFQRAYELTNENIIKPAWAAIQKAWEDFTAPTDLQSNAMGARDMWFGGGRGPSQAEQMGRGILGAIESAFKWVSGNLSGPIATASDALSKVFVGAMTLLSTDDQARATLAQAFETLGNDLAVPLLKGLGKGLAGGIWALLGMQIGPRGGNMPATGSPFAPQLIGGPGTAQAPVTGPDTPGAISQAVSLIPAGIDAVKGFFAGLTGQEATAATNEGARVFGQNVMEAVDRVLKIYSPSAVMAERGVSTVEGFNEGIADASSLTGPVVRMWLRSEVIAQAQQILITGEGKSGGLPGVARDALDAFGEVFASPPPGLAQNMRALGVLVTESIMDPIEDPRTGVVARMRRQINAMPHAPAAGGGDTLPTPNAGERFAATGQDFVVGGSGGTDSQNISLWATPGERVTVGNTRGGQQVTNHFQFNINGGDPEEVRSAVAAGIQEGMGEHHESTPNQMLNAWRMAKAQGANKPYGTQSRGARG